MSEIQFKQTVADEEQQQDEDMLDALREYRAEHIAIDDGYDLDDPKHPTWYERQCDRADFERKAKKEDALLEAWASEVDLKIETLLKDKK